ncbi:unnamed protein product [Linum tenue]|uniref:Uncharacterized protein n=1 Tax=Linum tenue TaxID=586396 RepID=A0AAV0RNZ6_9ROSI|nr:unnamed protein product [Linum tenue]
MGKAFAYYTEGSFFYLGVDPSIFGGSNVFKGTFYCECSNERSLALVIPSTLLNHRPIAIYICCYLLYSFSFRVVTVFADSFNLLVNNGAAAGQVIYHSLPRYSVVFDQEASRLVSSIREQLMDVSGDYKHQESTPSRFSL